MWLIIYSFIVLKTDYENYALQINCQNIDESSHQEVINLLIRNTCWPYQNKDFLKLRHIEKDFFHVALVYGYFFLTKTSDFVELQIDYLEELGLYVDNFVKQEKCDDGIGRPDCDTGIIDGTIDEICSFDFENFILNVEEFLQTFIDLLFNMFQ